MKYDDKDEETRQFLCNDADSINKNIMDGKYVFDGGASFIFLGGLAATAPDDPSPVPDFAGLTNAQVLRLLLSNTYLQGNPQAPFWHFAGGDMNELYYSDFNRWTKLAVSLSPYMPLKTRYDYAACNCDQVDLKFDDHFDKIRVPIFYMGTEGALGSYGLYTSELTASNDISSYIVDLPDAEPNVDFGHGDLFLGYDAADLVWSKLYDWLKDHQGYKRR
jgi:hypothetical protein